MSSSEDDRLADELGSSAEDFLRLQSKLRIAKPHILDQILEESWTRKLKAGTKRETLLPMDERGLSGREVTSIRAELEERAAKHGTSFNFAKLNPAQRANVIHDMEVASGWATRVRESEEEEVFKAGR